MKTMTRLLCVDDEPQVLGLIKDTLEDSYEIVLAPNATEAMKIFESDPNIQAVLSDHFLGDENGIELLAQIREKRPEVPRILISGYIDLVDVLSTIEKGVVTRFIKKPWSMDSFKRVIHSAITHH